MGILKVCVFLLIFIEICTGQLPKPAVTNFTIPAKTSQPFTYCIDYTPAPDHPSYLLNVAQSPPDLFHVGYHIPFKAALGPTYGHELFSNDILKPDEIETEIRRIENLIREMKKNGISRLIPYVYTMAFFGRSDQRSGFFNFFDHWNDYRPFGLGPKPPSDPILWQQVRQPAQLGGGPPGILHYEPCINHPAWSEYLNLVVRELASVGYDGMFFDVNTLYCYCPHCQEKFDIYLLNKYGEQDLTRIFGTSDHQQLNMTTIYRDFEKVILGEFEAYLLAKNLVNAEGEFGDLRENGKIKLDNDWRLLRCYMQNSVAEFPPQTGFREFLQERFGFDHTDKISEGKEHDFRQTVLRCYFYQYLESEALANRLKAAFGSADIRRRCCGQSRELLLWVETQRFWCRSMADLFARLKGQGRFIYAEAGRTGDFYTVANLGSMATLDGLNKRRVDGIDMVHWAPAADLQMLEEMNQIGVLESGVVLSNIFAFKWAMAAGTRAGSLLYKVKDDRSADLAHAEVAAAGGGAFIQPGVGAALSRQHWKKFFAEHAALWQGGESWAEVGLLFWSDQVFYENTDHLALTRALVHIFSENQIPFNIITEENLSALSAYRLVIAPKLRYLNPDQIAVLSDYAARGGNLVIIPPLATEDKSARIQEPDLYKIPNFAQQKFKALPCEQGRVLWVSAAQVPERKSDFWALMEERGNDFAAAQEFLDKARRQDIAMGVDLGSGFIENLEKALQLDLRWCPPETDEAVYLQAYRIPAGEAGGEKIVLHLVNYHMPIRLTKKAATEEDPVWVNETRSGEVTEVKNLKIFVPLPVKGIVKSVNVKSTTDNDPEIAWTQKNNKVQLSINILKIYQAVVLELE